MRAQLPGEFGAQWRLRLFQPDVPPFGDYGVGVASNSETILEDLADLVDTSHVLRQGSRAEPSSHSTGWRCGCGEGIGRN